MILLRACCILAALLLACAAAAAAVGPEPIRRDGYVSVSLTPALSESNLAQPGHLPPLEQLFRTRTGEFADSLAEGLERTAFRGDLQTFPGYLPQEQDEMREAIDPEHFLVAVDLSASYGHSEISPLAACLSAASCFLLSPFDMFTFESRLEASVNVFYIDRDGRRRRLVQQRHRVRGKVSGDFFDAMSVAREMEWVTFLTDEGLTELKARLLAELPQEVMQRAWSTAGEELARSVAKPPRRPRPTSCPTVATDDKEPRGDAPAAGLATVVRRVSPSVFKVLTEQGTGSGFVLSRRGYGLTSLHVVEGSETVNIRFHGGAELPARVVLSEPSLDLAILAFAAGEVPPLALGDSDRLTVGDAVTAIGYPRDLGLSVIQGKVSSLEPHQGTPLIRIEADLPPGNSGGPLLNTRGEGVGINFLRSTRAGDATAFGIPINLARKTFSHLLDPSDR